MLIAEELLDWGFEVDVAYNGREGIAAIIKKGWPDLVLCDVCMPGMSGFEVLQRLNTMALRFRKTHFVFLTALTDLHNEIKGRQLGAANYVTKPIDFDVLARIVTAQLAPETDIAVEPVKIITSVYERNSSLHYDGASKRADMARPN
jgi:DNA-binding response OmpR family regulator